MHPYPQASDFRPMGASAAARETRPFAAGHRHRRLLALAAVLVLAFAVRLGCAFGLRTDVRATFRFDMSVYDLLARHLANGKGYVGYLGLPTAFFPPGYPAILGAAYRLFGDGLATAWTMHALLGALTCLLVYAIAAHLFTPAVGLAAAAILAVFPGDVFGATVTMSEVTFGCLLAAILYLFVRWNDAVPTVPPSRWFLFGVVLGGATLVRGIALPFLAVPFVIWALADGLRTAVARTALAASALLLVVLPWTARNYFVMGYPILLGGDAPFAFFNAHNPLAFGSQSVAMNHFRRREWPWLEKLPLPQQEVEEARAEVRYALDYIVTHPRQELGLVPRRIYYLYAHDHYALLPGSLSPRRHVLLVRYADAYFFATVVLALVGLVAAFPLASPSALVLPLTIAYITFMHGVLFFGDPRYHAPLVPVFSILAAVGLHALRRRMRRLA